MGQAKENGIIRIAHDVIAVIANVAALDTDGITHMAGGLTDRFTKKGSGKYISKGIHVTMEDEKVWIDLRVIIKFGRKIDTVCRQVQLNVKEAVENMTGLLVEEVNVRVEGIDFEKGEAYENRYVLEE